MYVLGVSCYYHDAAAALLHDGVLIAAAEEERFSRVKHDYGFPRNAIRFCLDQAGIEGRDLDYVVFFEKPFRKFDRILMTALQTYPQSWKVFRESMISWMTDKLWIGATLQTELGVSKEKVLFCEHHLSHAASAYLCSPFDEAAILTVDGVGEWVTATCGVGRGNEIRLLKQIEFPHSIGLLYSAFTAFLGFEVNEGEYKVMGMAPYGVPRYVDKVWKLVQPEHGRLVFARHGLLLLPPFDRPDLQPQVCSAVWRASSEPSCNSSPGRQAFPSTSASRRETTTNSAS